MGIFYFDTSAIAKRYIWEPGSRWIRTLADPAAGHDLYLARITDVELTSALARRRGRPGFGHSHSSTALGHFRMHTAGEYRTVEVTIPVLQQASVLADRHALRGYDAVQLAAALEVAASFPTLMLVSADGELNKAAIAEGMAIEDPNDHP